MTNPRNTVEYLLIMKPKYYLNESGEFVIENYNYTKPFANFFPGIAGKYGIPMWVFYVNRGQAISSFGTKGKGHSILEFFPANKSWQLVTSHGFRTFIKITGAKGVTYYEPFHNGLASRDFSLSNRMLIAPGSLTIEEENRTLGLKVRVDYFNIPNDSYAGLVRQVSIENLSSKAIKIQLLDGLPQIIPFGTTNLFLKHLGRTIEAWMRVENLSKGVPFYKLDVDPTDRPEIIHINEGHFYLGFREKAGKAQLLKPIIDPDCIFGPVSDFSYPREFLEAKNFSYPKRQINNSKTPCAVLLVDLDLPAKGKKDFSVITGYMRGLKSLNTSIKRIASRKYLAAKAKENREIIDGLTQDIFTASSSRELNLYARQTYLDNIMRGGYPMIFKFGKSSSVFYLYSRKHGDLERDYNRYSIQPTYFSQGNGNFRDINQNRRCDIWFNPEIGEENLVYFFNLMQADGFNPLVVKGAGFLIKDRTYLEMALKDLVAEKDVARLNAYLLQKQFTPGELLVFLEENKIGLRTSLDDFLSAILSHCIKVQDAEYQEGFWTDHWTYSLDLLDAYLEVYPEKLKEIVFDKKIFTYHDSAETVKPRKEKYTLYRGLPRQLKSVATDPEKLKLILKRTAQPYVVRTCYGEGQIYATNLFNKLLCLLANKAASLDPSGIGIEMEANKPNWYDALNGLPALFGSSLCETIELKRLVLFIKEALKKTGIKKVEVAEEVLDFLAGLNALLEENLKGNGQDRDFRYWDKSYSLKEAYRKRIHLGLSGNEMPLETALLGRFLDNALSKADSAIKKAKAKKNELFSSYFLHEVTEYDTAGDEKILPVKFRRKDLPLFLEGQMHALRIAGSYAEAKKLYDATKKSPLFDRKLKMYKVTASLKDMPFEIGRCRVFTPGWLENESIWLHMEYKYLLEALKQGLYGEFYADFKNVLIPFLDPETYGRSILENSSFLVSSAFPDEHLHGNGFVARLSGSTAEFIQLWLIMNCGLKPFFLNKEGKLNLRFSPALAGWLFTKDGTYNFHFLSKVSVTYHNPKRKDTFGKSAAKVKRISFMDKDGKVIDLACGTIGAPYAEQIRSRQVKKIDIYLG